MTARVLVVDDEPAVGRTLAALLQSRGYSVTVEGSAEAALERLASEAFDLVVLDVWLPGMSGFDACERLRERHGPSLPVMLLTAHGEPEALRRGLEVGADDFVHKPPEPGALLLKVQSLLRMKQLRDEAERHREEAQRRVAALAQLHEIGRDWSLMADPREFNRMVTARLARLTGASVCMIVLFDRAANRLRASLPAHGLDDETARKVDHAVSATQRAAWDLRSGRPYVANDLSEAPGPFREVVEIIGADSLAMVPMLSEGDVLGALVACNRPGGFSDAEAQLLSIFAGPAATFVRSRQIFATQRQQALARQRLADLVAALAGTAGRGPLIQLAASRLQADLECAHVSFHAAAAEAFASEAEAGVRPAPPVGEVGDQELISWALRDPSRASGMRSDGGTRLAVPVRAGERVLGVLLLHRPSRPFDDDESSLLATAAGQLAVALLKAESAAETERLAGQMATLYELGLETAALRDLHHLFVKATEEAGRLIRADHTSAFRLDARDGTLRLFTVWGRDPTRESYSEPVFRLGEGIAGQVARDGVPALVNDASDRPDFVPRGNPVSRLITVPLTYLDREAGALRTFGVMNATRRPGAPPFTHHDLTDLMRFAGQLSIAAANSMAFASERERSEQLELVSSLLKEITGQLSRQRILETAATRIRESFGFDTVVFLEPDREAGVSRVAALAGREPPGDDWRARPLDAGLAGRVSRERVSVVLPDVSTDPDYDAVAPSVRSEALIPVLAAGEVVAILVADSDQPRRFDHALVMTLETLADGIGIILRNAELFRALEESNARLVELDRMKSELVNIVAHDFRAPLAAILGRAELIEWRPDAPAGERTSQAQAIVRAATHMASLVDKTLKTMRLDTGHFPFDFAVVDLSEIARGAVERLQLGPAHRLEVDLPEDPAPCWGDRDRLAEVLDNLLGNAVKYSPDGGTVRLALATEGERFTLRVADEGIGIAEEDRPRLFRAFSRLRNARTAAIQGTGLGLYICDRIARTHGGSLRLDGAVGRGAAFVVELPRFGAGVSSLPLLLLAASDEATRRDVRRVAEEAGFALHEATDGVEALEAAVRLLPRVVVLDTVLPGMSPADVAARLKQDERLSGVRVIGVGASASLPAFDAWVAKPVDPVDLRRALAVGDPVTG